METPSDRVLSSWRQHAREGWEVEKYQHYRPRIMCGFGTVFCTLPGCILHNKEVR